MPKLKSDSCPICCPNEKIALFTREQQWDPETAAWIPTWKCTNCLGHLPRRLKARSGSRFILSVSVIQDYGTPSSKTLRDKRSRHHSLLNTRVKAHAIFKKLTEGGRTTRFQSGTDEGYEFLGEGLMIEGYDADYNKVEVKILDMGDARERADQRKKDDAKAEIRWAKVKATKEQGALS